ncbi:MAG: FAD-dependent oxidoreductase [Kastovskya adunca ATA6-11-RM4]|jgi:hypothetical protein|nr:FAD-dependent oxidoreductase [Kastovskya adunca ATA6-11-RM4]
MVDSIKQPNGILSKSAFTRPANGTQLSYPILVVGSSTASYTATLGALRTDPQVVVCLVIPQQVLGGQFTAQALPASDDGDQLKSPNGEAYSISKTHRSFRNLQRSLQAVSGQVVKNPGGGWVSPLCTTPVTSARALNEAIAPYITQKRLIIIPFAEPMQVITTTSGQRRRVTGVVFRDTQNGANFTVSGQVVIEATDLGDLLELGNIESRVGQEARSETGEPLLPEVALPRCQQSITYCVLLERTAPGRGVSIGKPIGYGEQPWLLPTDFTGKFWTRKSNLVWEARDFFHSYGIFSYRRLQRVSLRESNVSVGDVTVLNWSTSPRGPSGKEGSFYIGNDYRNGIIVGVSREERQATLKRARDRSRAYAHFLQVSEGKDLKPRGDLTWTSDGIALEPYIREARRGVALSTIRHQDVAKAFFPGQARARTFDDSVGIGQYHYLDIHGNDEPGQVSLPGDYVLALPFSISMGALVPINTDGLILSSKSLGTTHITNGAYRMHPVEWAIGEAGGALAAMAIRENVEARDIVLNEPRKRKLQGLLARNGVPLIWFDDITHDDPDYEAIQVLATAGIVRSESNANLNFRPQAPVNRAVVCTALVKVLGLPLVTPTTPTFSDVPSNHWAYVNIESLYAQGLIAGLGSGRFAPDQPITQLHLSFLIRKVDQLIVPGVYNLAISKIPTTNRNLQRRELSRVLYEVYRMKLGLIGTARLQPASINRETDTSSTVEVVTP